MPFRQDFEQVGFLSAENLGFYQRLLQEHKPLWDLCSKLNELAQEFCYLDNRHIPIEDVKNILIIGLYAKALEDYQAALILTSKGMRQQALTQIRALLEVTFIVVGCIESHDFYQAYISSDDADRRMTFSRIKNHAERVYACELDLLIPTLSKEGRVLPNQAAKAAKMIDYYNKYYSILSYPSHTLFRSIDRKIDLNTYSIVHEPTSTGMGYVLFSSLEIFHICLSRVGNHFNHSFTGWQEMIEKINHFASDPQNTEYLQVDV